MSHFWQAWLRVWCWSVGLFGVGLAGAGLPATGEPSRLLLDLMNGAEPFVLSQSIRFCLSVLGSVTLGWSITLWAAIKAANLLGAPGRPIWNLVIMSAIGWFVVDSALSIATGFGLNAVANTLFIVTLLVPIWRSGVLKP